MSSSSPPCSSTSSSSSNNSHRMHSPLIRHPSCVSAMILSPRHQIRPRPSPHNTSSSPPPPVSPASAKHPRPHPVQPSLPSLSPSSSTRRHHQASISARCFPLRMPSSPPAWATPRCTSTHLPTLGNHHPRPQVNLLSRTSTARTPTHHWSPQSPAVANSARASAPSKIGRPSEPSESGETSAFQFSLLLHHSPLPTRRVKALESRSQLLDAALASADEANRRWEECRALVDQLRIENAALRAALSGQAQLGGSLAPGQILAGAPPQPPQQTQEGRPEGEKLETPAPKE